MENNSTRLWVFGYGSLVWHPGFQTNSSMIGFVQNYVRRFWQGNTTHRGIPGKPGRVATMVKEDKGMTWGVAYEVTGEKALDYLNRREITLGGYISEIETFYPRDVSINPFPVLLYIATPTSKDWAGPAPLLEIATQITQSSGPTGYPSSLLLLGHNVEYLLRLAEFMRDNIPDGYDDHLSTLEALVRIRVKEKCMCLKTLMGESPNTATGQGVEVVAVAIGAVDGNGQGHPAVEERRDTFQYSAQLPKKKLRCLNV